MSVSGVLASKTGRTLFLPYLNNRTTLVVEIESININLITSLKKHKNKVMRLGFGYNLLLLRLFSFEK